MLPGFVDTHVHFPQVRVIGALGHAAARLARAQCALPEEARLADVDVRRAAWPRDFVTGLVGAGTTTALVFGAHFAAAVDALFAEADAASGCGSPAGLVVSDRILRDDLLTTPERAYDEGLALAEALARRRAATATPSPRASRCRAPTTLLDSCGALLADVAGLVVHLPHQREPRRDRQRCSELFADCADYLDAYARHGLVGPRSVFAHNVHPTAARAGRPGRARAPRSRTARPATPPSAAACSRCASTSTHGVRVALGSDVGAGTGFSLFKEGLQAYFVQQLLGDARAPADLARTCCTWRPRPAPTRSGWPTQVGDFSVGKQFDAVLAAARRRRALDVALRHADSPEDALAKAFALAGPADVARVWVGGRSVPSPSGAQLAGVGVARPVADAGADR